MKTIKFNTMMLVFLLTNVLYGQENELKNKKDIAHFVYVTPSAVPGIFLDFNMFNYWAEAGYGILINKSMINFDAGILVYPYPTSERTGSFNIGQNLHQIKSTGYNFALEYKYNERKRFFVGVYIYYHFMETLRNEKLYYNNNLYSGKIGDSQYKVNRTEFGFLPKIGWAIIDKRKVSCDISWGLGLRYVSSKSHGKQNPSVNKGKEMLTLKVFDDGDQLMLKVLPHFRIGYAF